MAARDASPAEAAYLQLVESRIRNGNLAEHIRAAVERRRAGKAQHDALLAVYGDLADCLERNEPYACHRFL